MRFLYKLISVIVGLTLIFTFFIPSASDEVVASVTILCIVFLAYQDQHTKKLLADKTKSCCDSNER